LAITSFIFEEEVMVMSDSIFVRSKRTVDEACEMFKVSRSYIRVLAVEEGLEVEREDGNDFVDVFQVLKAIMVRSDKREKIGWACRMYANLMLWNRRDGMTLDDLTCGFYTAYMKYVGPRYLGVPNLSIVDMKFHMSRMLRKMRKSGEVVKTFRPFCGSKKVVWLRKEYASKEDIKLDRTYSGKRYLFTIVDGKVVCTKYLYRNVRGDELEDLINIMGYIRNLIREYNVSGNLTPV
jgi:hypothetical protein